MKILVGGDPPHEGIDLRIDYEGYRRERDAEWTVKLDVKRARCIGAFDTSLPCNCGKANVIDHAEQSVPRRDLLNTTFGPVTTAEERYRAFQVRHRYFCDECGASYVNSVIEGKGRYIPRESYPEPE